MQSLIQSKVDKLAGRLSLAYHQGTVVQLDSALSASATDIISESLPALIFKDKDYHHTLYRVKT